MGSMIQNHDKRKKKKLRKEDEGEDLEEVRRSHMGNVTPDYS